MTTPTVSPYLAPFALDEPRSYPFHRLGRASANHRWWRPLVVAVVAIGFYLGFLLSLFLPLVIVALVFPAVGAWLDESNDALDAIDLSDPVTFGVVMLSIILMLPAIILANLLLGARPAGLLTSVAGRLRWRWFARCSGLAAAVCSGGMLVSFGVGMLTGQPVMVADVNPNLALMLVLVLLLVPFQAAAEEYIFRGYLMQTIGTWLRHPAFAILLPVPLFIVGHDYELLGMIDVGIFAIAAGWLTWRTGGLEAAVALHIVNNVLIFALGAWGLLDVNASDSTVGGLVVSLAITIVFVFVVVRDADHLSIARERPHFANNSQ
ncbi:type II CAAX endopeptidase family protein [Rhodoglobus sp. NPDC076762]